MGMTCGGKCGMIFLIILNILFMMLGLALLVLGIVMQVDSGIVNDNITPLLNQLSIGSLSLGDLVSGLSITFIVFGAFVLIIAAFGAFGACCQKKSCLVIYSIIVGIFLVGKIVAVILWFVLNDKLQSWLKDNLTSQLENNYRFDDITSHEISTAWNYMFMELSCCGVKTGTSSDFTSTPWQAGTPGYSTPKGCCPSTTASNYATASNTCTATYYSTGCYDAVYDKLSTYSTGFIVTGVIILVIEVRSYQCQNF
ncbi:hypothetical protein FSP39_018414 [Pinctada imbricata]|uniref:Tetraspanin n=1 Tax=Pinctada imbricata TaxID=66713 RepID=A0AA88YKV7_PINIB|nr:hypothetical protein FSP39_018414 [Pinctada imbricata]